jgi:hypothetical protein
MASLYEDIRRRRLRAGSVAASQATKSKAPVNGTGALEDRNN